MTNTFWRAGANSGINSGSNSDINPGSDSYSGSGPSRRFVLGGLSATLGVIALRGGQAQGNTPVYFTHGVASGDPLDDRVILWTRVIPADGKRERVSGVWEVAKDEAFMMLVARGDFTTDAGRDYTVKIDALGLAPGNQYFYRFRVGDVKSTVGKTRTLPTKDVGKIRLGVVSCSNYPQGYFNVYKALAHRDFDAILHLGDYIYEYADGGYSNPDIVAKGRKVEPAHELIKLEDYRMRYGLYRSDPDLQAVHKNHAFINVWDDHEIANDTWKEGAENHDASEGPFDARRRAAIQAFYEWIPIREKDPDLEGRIYRTFEFGELASLIMLDTRLIGRDKQLKYPDDLPFRKIPFDFSDPDNPKALLSGEALAGAPKSAIKEIQVPFDFSSGQPVPVTDWSVIKALDPRNLPKGLAYLPDARKFKEEVVGDPSRTILGDAQEAWLADTLKASKTKGKPWQILGQQLLMGKVNVPKIATEDIDPSKSDYVTPEQIGFFRLLEQMDLPLNLDAWDGYAACRERVFAALRENANNAVVLAGDTHNAWAFNLADADGRNIAVEFATPGVSSPGLETYLPVDPAKVERALLEKNSELDYVNAKDRGWLELTVTRDTATSDWYFVSSVLSEDYEIIRGETRSVKADSHKFG